MENQVVDLTEVTIELGSAYRSWKESEKLKNTAKSRFFKLATDQQEGLAEKYVNLPGVPSEARAKEELERSYPEWNIEALRECHSGYEAILTENPEYKPFSFVNPQDGYVYSRQIVSGSILLDDERMKEENLDLYNKVTSIPNEKDIRDLIYHCGIHQSEIEETLNRLWKGPRELRPLEDLDDKTLAALQEYVYFGKPTVKLAAPRKAKSEEL